MSAPVADLSALRRDRGLPVAEMPDEAQEFQRPTPGNPRPDNPPFPGVWRADYRIGTYVFGSHTTRTDIEPAVAVLLEVAADLTARLERLEAAESADPQHACPAPASPAPEADPMPDGILLALVALEREIRELRALVAETRTKKEGATE